MSSPITVIEGDSRAVLKTMADCSIDSCVTDPPYALTSIVKRFGKAGAAPAKGNAAFTRASAGFMGQAWDTGETAFDPEFWKEVYRVLKPGAHVLAFSGTRTYHRMACAIEDAGFEIRDQIGWAFGSGFPKSHDVSKSIDKHLGRERKKVRVDASQARNPKTTGGGKDGTEGASRPFIESAKALGYHEAVSDEAVSWQGWGTALKPAWEPICVARKPLIGTVAKNVLKHGTGAININDCRVEAPEGSVVRMAHTETGSVRGYDGGIKGGARIEPRTDGRWPANLVHDGSDEVLAAFPESDGQQGDVRGTEPSSLTNEIYGKFNGRPATVSRGDSGSAARFFYTAKADAEDRLGSKHPTVKPVDLMQWLVRLVTPKGGLVLDPFAGSGTTGIAAKIEGVRAVLIERDPTFAADIRTRLDHAAGTAAHSAGVKMRNKRKEPDGPLFVERP